MSNEKEKRIEIIDKPYIYWRNEWKECIRAVVYDPLHVYVHVTPGQVVVMELAQVYRNSRDVAKVKGIIKGTRWVVDRRGNVHEAVLDFRSVWHGSPKEFVMVLKNVPFNPYGNLWRVSALEHNKKEKRINYEQMFTKESAAVRYAARMVKRQIVAEEKNRLVHLKRKLEKLEKRRKELGVSA